MAGRDVVAELAVNLTLESAQFASGASAAEARAKTLEGRMGALGAKAKSVSGALTGLAGGFIAGIGVSTIASAIAGGLEYASSLGEVAQQLGVTTKELQTYRYAASQAGVEQNTMDQSLARLTKNLGLASSGNKAMAANFERLGISLKNADGSFKTAGEALPEIAEKLKGVANPAERAAILTQLFGKSGQQLGPLLAGGAAGVNELTTAAEKLGLVISDENIAKADEAADKWAAYKQVIGVQLAQGVVAGLDALQKFNAGMDAHSTAIGQEIGAIKAAFSGMAGSVTASVRNMMAGVKSAFASFTGYAERVGREVNQVKGAFFDMWDKVTRRSYVPDMMDDISREFDRLQPEMVAKATKTTGATADKFKALRDEVRTLMDELFPEMQALREYKKDLATIDAGEKAGLLSPDMANEARYRAAGVEDAPLDILGTGSLVANDNDVYGELERYSQAVADHLVDPTKRGTADVIEAYGQMAAGVIDGLRGMVSSFKRGDILGGITQMLDLVTQVIGALKGIGVIGGSPGGMEYGGARAMGGPVVPGKSYLVGENGPEFVSFGRKGYVTPPKDGGAPTRLTVVPSEYFNLVVDQRASNVAAPLAGRAALAGASGGVGAMTRRQRRAIP